MTTSIDSLQEKLEEKKAENKIRNINEKLEDDSDGAHMSVPLLKQKLRLFNQMTI